MALLTTKIIKENGPMDFVLDYISPEMDMKKKDGGSYKGHEIKIKTRSNNMVYDSKMFPNEVKSYKVGELINASLNDRGYIQWRKVQSGEQRNNYDDVKAEQGMKTAAQEYDKKGLRISMQGYKQCFIESGKTIEEARKLAVEELIWDAKNSDAISKMIP